MAAKQSIANLPPTTLAVPDDWLSTCHYDTTSAPYNAAVERRRTALSSAQQAHNEMARLLSAPDDV
jgi:hypothetical protein